MQDCKTQILSSLADNNCCSLTFANTVFLTSSQINDYESILIMGSEQLRNKIAKIITNFYPSVSIHSWQEFLLLSGNIYQLLSDIDYSENLNLSYFANDCDKITFLKTLFITCGNFYYNQDSNLNSKGYNFEIVLKNENLANIALEIFKEHGFELKKIKRLSSFVLYTKNSNVICDLFVFLGATYTALDIQNNLAMREIRNSTNRQNNCFEGNLDKTINASNIQLEAINFIIDNYSIDYLDENLREVALTRIANPDVSLNEMRMLLNNKISRAGIKYRLDKIIDIYKKLKGE